MKPETEEQNKGEINLLPSQLYLITNHLLRSGLKTTEIVDVLSKCGIKRRGKDINAKSVGFIFAGGAPIRPLTLQQKKEALSFLPPELRKWK